MQLTFYTRSDCPLCEKGWPVAERIAGRFALPLRRVDIAGDPALRSRHGERIPVLELDGVELGWGRLSERALERRLIRLREGP